jgi:hypothetical protein
MASLYQTGIPLQQDHDSIVVYSPCRRKDLSHQIGSRHPSAVRSAEDAREISVAVIGRHREKLNRMLHRSFRDRDFNMQRTQCNENPNFAICEIVIESRPSDPEMIRTIDLTSHRSLGDRNLEVTRPCNIRNVEIVICNIALQS